MQHILDVVAPPTRPQRVKKHTTWATHLTQTAPLAPTQAALYASKPFVSQSHVSDAVGSLLHGRMQPWLASKKAICALTTTHADPACHTHSHRGLTERWANYAISITRKPTHPRQDPHARTHAQAGIRTFQQRGQNLRTSRATYAATRTPTTYARALVTHSDMPRTLQQRPCAMLP